MANRLELGRVSIAYGRQMVVRDISFKLAPGHIGCLLGPSGCGKTTLLRAIAGLQPISQGSIHLDEARVSSADSQISPELRGVGMVFQDCALFPHLNVGQNVAFGLQKLGSKEAARRLAEVLRQTGLREVEKSYPHQLTDGLQQRVALARAIAPKPRLLLIDEPFSKFDADLRERVPQEVRDILLEAGMTALLSTHDQRDAFAMADEIGVMSNGHLLQWGGAETIYQRPANRFVANFIGQGTILTAQMAPGVGISSEIGFLPLPDGGVSLRGRPYLEILVRPQHVVIEPAGGGSPGAAIGEITRKTYRGSDMLYTLRLPGGTEILALAPTDTAYTVGDKVEVKLKPHHPAILHMGD